MFVWNLLPTEREDAVGVKYSNEDMNSLATFAVRFWLNFEKLAIQA